MEKVWLEQELAQCKYLWAEIVSVEPETDIWQFVTWAIYAGYLTDFFAFLSWALQEGYLPESQLKKSA